MPVTPLIEIVADHGIEETLGAIIHLALRDPSNPPLPDDGMETFLETLEYARSYYRENETNWKAERDEI